MRVFDKKTPNSVEMITDYKVVDKMHNAALIEATLITGRTHQLRASFAHIGCPILGDEKYGDYDFNKNSEYRTLYRGGLCLCAVEIAFKLAEASAIEYLNNIHIRIAPPFCVNPKEQ